MIAGAGVLCEPNVYDGQLDDVSLALGHVACCGILQRKRHNMPPRGTGSGAKTTLVSDECCIITCRFATKRDTHYRYRKTVTVVEIVQANSMDVGEYIHPDFRIILDAEDGPARGRSLCSP